VFAYIQIEDILKSYGEMLGQIAYMLTEDINRLITDEAQVWLLSHITFGVKLSKFVYQLIASLQLIAWLPVLLFIAMCHYRLSTWLSCQTKENILISIYT